ncbi:MAG: Mu-like prophage major head subunit gpT family protein, partial [Dokdonella sp.]
AYREARQAGAANDGSGGSGTGGGAAVTAPLTSADVDARIRMVEARANARVLIAGSKLPDPLQERLVQRFAEAVSFTDAEVSTAIEAERKLLGRLVEGAQVRGLGEGRVEAGQDRSEKVSEMFDNFFDPKKPMRSFREAYIDVTGDRQVSGLIQNCDTQRLREAVGEQRFAEAVSAATFGNILGNSITRAMIRDYGSLEAYGDWRWLADVVPVTDFRTQERTRMGGYGNLPAVAENGPYNALTSPTDEKATYAVSKRGGTETVSLEAIANDDVGLIRRLPMSLAVAAGRTLYEFVHDFLATNAVIYDATALFIAGHNNIGVAALDATSFAAARLRMKKQTEKDSGKRLGLTLRHVAVPGDLEEAAYNLFVRTTNLDESFTQSRKPKVHVVDYWTDANNWFATADNSQCPLIEIGFYGGKEEPELFVQDMPTQGSLFTNDQIKYKIRHIYSGAVRDFRGFDGSIVP